MIPLNALFLVFRLKNWLFLLPIFCHLLFDEHEMIEELLQFLIGKVDAELFEWVPLHNLEPGYIQHPDKTSQLGVGHCKTFDALL